MTWDRSGCVLPTTHQFMDAERYFQMPAGPPFFELIDGELFMAPSPELFHQAISVVLSSSLHAYLKAEPLGRVFYAPSDVLLSEKDVLQPDVYFVRKERFNILQKQGPKGAPDLVVEIPSDSTARLDLGPKKSVYASAGVEEFWVVDPRAQQVRVFRFEDSSELPAVTFVIGEALRSGVFPGWELPLEELFAAL